MELYYPQPSVLIPSAFLLWIWCVVQPLLLIPKARVPFSNLIPFSSSFSLCTEKESVTNHYNFCPCDYLLWLTPVLTDIFIRVIQSFWCYCHCCTTTAWQTNLFLVAALTVHNGKTRENLREVIPKEEKSNHIRKSSTFPLHHTGSWILCLWYYSSSTSFASSLSVTITNDHIIQQVHTSRSSCTSRTITACEILFSSCVFLYVCFRVSISWPALVLDLF